MRIAHEAPLSIMRDIRTLTDYDYALVHLFEDSQIGEKYYRFFKNSLLMDREVILDNSIFELGEAFSIDRFKEWVEKLNPTYYIIPDSLENCDQTIKNIRDWFGVIHSLPLKPVLSKDCKSKSIGVVQGKTYEEIVKCYQYINQFCDKIAIPFDFSWYHKVCPHKNSFYSMMYGRQYLIDKLRSDGIINRGKPHHLLGCSIPQEFSYYRWGTHDFLESVDTSNPVVHGLKGIKYQHYGLETKETQKLVDLINTEVSGDQLRCIYNNIKHFQKFAIRK